MRPKESYPDLLDVSEWTISRCRSVGGLVVHTRSNRTDFSSSSGSQKYTMTGFRWRCEKISSTQNNNMVVTRKRKTIVFYELFRRNERGRIQRNNAFIVWRSFRSHDFRFPRRSVHCSTCFKKSVYCSKWWIRGFDTKVFLFFFFFFDDVYSSPPHRWRPRKLKRIFERQNQNVNDVEYVFHLHTINVFHKKNNGTYGYNTVSVRVVSNYKFEKGIRT